MPAVTSAIEKRPACSAIVAWNSIWYRTSPSSSMTASSDARVVGVERGEGVDELERLLHEVGHE